MLEEFVARSFGVDRGPRHADPDDGVRVERLPFPGLEVADRKEGTELLEKVEDPLAVEIVRGVFGEEELHAPRRTAGEHDLDGERFLADPELFR